MSTLAQLASLQGRTALITGGAGHLGTAFASALAEQGAAIALLDFHEEKCRASAARLQSAGARALP
ncbi:MAG TPA: SDR family NAD(P)-dependent oxidoreductase, partial [Prosthecobacter sp.]|nr:SDR family NAD(P)-dependent oxidoreductase [Prosthecobacter sp.]